MLFSRRLFQKKQHILRYTFYKTYFHKFLLKSLFKNHYISYLHRLSYNIQFNKPNEYLSKQRLICPYTFSKKVPSKRFFFSRFFLNSKLNTLKFNNTVLL